MERGVNKGYGNYKCSKCGQKKLNGYYNFVGQEDDVDGHEWRGFCNRCWEEVKHMTDEEIYAQFDAAKETI